MKSKLSSIVLITTLVTLCACTSMNEQPKPQAEESGDKKYISLRTADQIEQASKVYRDLITASDGGIPEKLLASADCIAVLPEVLKGAFIAGGRYGTGIVSCQNEDGRWSSPAFITMTSSSVGFQIGAEATDLVLVFVGKNSVTTLLDGSITLGGDIRVAAGPVGRSVEGKTDFSTTGVYSYAKSKGLFAGISIEGSILKPDWDANKSFYGKDLETRAILFGRVDNTPKEALAFLELLP